MPNRYIGAAQQGSWYAGFGAPDSALGTDGDLYLNLTNGQGYYKSSGSWATQTIGTGGGGGLVDGDYGDITVSGTGTAMTIDAGAVSNSKLADMAAHTFKLRKTNSTGEPEDATPAEALAILGPSTVVLAPAYTTPLTVDLTNYAMYSRVIVNIGVLTGNITVNITNGFHGQAIVLQLTQDSTGGRTFTGGANIRYSASTPAPALSVGGNIMDRLGFEWHSTAGKADLVAINKSYS